MGIGYRIKEARERLGLTQTELGAKVGVTGSAITNYEKETSHPKEQVIYQLMETLGVDANYLFQDVVKVKSPTSDITLAEYDLIEKYRKLDSLGQEAVLHILDIELRRSQEKITIYASPENLVLTRKQLERINREVRGEAIPFPSLNAAHTRTDVTPTSEDILHDNDLMDDDNF